MFKIIACINQKRALGKDGKLLYTIKNDLANFKRQTLGNVVIMGRKTFESLPHGEPLKDRINIILTSNEEYGVSQDFDNVYIVGMAGGGGHAWNAVGMDDGWFYVDATWDFMDGDLVDELRLTVVKDDEEGDVTFPEFNEDEWSTYYKSMAQVSSWEGVDKSFYFHVLKRKK